MMNPETSHHASRLNRIQQTLARPGLKVLCLIVVGHLSVPFTQATGLSPDPDFRAPFFAKLLPSSRALLLPDGKYLLLFGPDTLTDQPTGAITRFLADGTLDTSFSFSRTYKGVSAATPANDGKLYVAATRYVYGTKEAEQILRLNADGSIDSGFAPATVGGTHTFQDVRQILVQADNKVLVAGHFSSFGGDDARDGIVRLLPNGALDTSFAPVTINSGEVWSAALQSDGKVLIAGTFPSVNGVANPGIVRLDTTGMVDSTFQASGFTRDGNSTIRAILTQGDGKILISGRFRFGTGPGAQRAPLFRLESNGNPDTTFTIFTNIPGLISGRDLALQADGKIVAAITSSIYRFNTNGSKDDTFRQPVMTEGTFSPPITGAPVSVHFLPDGRILTGGGFTDVDLQGTAPTYSHFGVARLTSTGDLDSSLVTSHKIGLETAPSSFARLDDGSTLISFSDKIDFPFPYNVGRLLSDGSRDPNFTLSSSDPNSFLLGGFNANGFEPLPDGNFFVFGTKTNFSFTYGKVAPSGVHDTSFATEPIHPFQEAIATPDGKVLLNAGSDAQATVYATLTRLKTDGHYDAFALPQSIRDAQVHRFSSHISTLYLGNRVLAVQPDGKILFVYFGDFFAGTFPFPFHVVRLNGDGSIDATFPEVTFNAIDPSQSFPVIFDPVTGMTYQPPEGAWTASLPLLDAHVQSDGRIVVVGQFKSYNGVAAPGIVRLETNGSVDSTFQVGGGAQWTTVTETATSFPKIENIEAQPDGKLIITGTFEAFNGVAAPGIASLNSDGSVDTSFVAPALRDKRSRVAAAFESQPDGSYLLSGPYTFPNETLSPSFIHLVPLAPMAANVSTRLAVGTGDDVLIEGFIVQGPPGSSKKIIVRALGPSLSRFGVGDALANPTLEIRDANNAIVATNNNWKITQLGGLITSDQFGEISASQLAPSDDLESAIIVNLAAGSYTAVVRGVDNTAGTGLVDAFDLSPASAARLANVATRGLIQPGDKLMIAGFIVQNGPIKVVIRAIGPSLKMFGISNALPDTTLQLRDQNGGIVLENDNWKTDQQQELEAIHLQPSHDLEAALVTTIQPGQYTAQVRGKGQDSGIGVVEVYFPK